MTQIVEVVSEILRVVYFCPTTQVFRISGFTLVPRNQDTDARAKYVRELMLSRNSDIFAAWYRWYFGGILVVFWQSA